MICTELYNGQGLGNQLWCYCVTRAIALQNKYEFGIQRPDKFKGKDFLNIDFGEYVIGGEGPEGGPPTKLPNGINFYYKEKRTNHPIYKCDISKFDPNLVSVPDNTKIDGTMQSEDYFYNIKNDVCKWLKIAEDKQVYEFKDNDCCIIHVRGGDFVGINEVFLPQQYYSDAMDKIKEENQNIKFYCVTDHPEAAIWATKNMATIIGSSIYNIEDEHKAEHHRGGPIWIDYSIINNAKYLIIPNSSFSWWAAWTNINAKKIIAPKYWARYNISDGFWSNGDSLTRDWYYLDKNGKLTDYNECLKEKIKYES